MVSEKTDPREVASHPRMQMGLIGHRDAEQRLLAAFQSGRMHHAWLITGPRGIGKATLAYRLARFVLHDGHSGSAAPTSLSVSADAPAARLMAAGAHPDLFVLQPQFDGKAVKTEIAVEDARHLEEFFGLTAGLSRWRVVIVDAADRLNRESANTLLKIAEEPPPNSLLIFVSHRGGRLLPTLRSRCISLPLSRLTPDDCEGVVRTGAASEGIADEDIREAVTLSRGSPGRAFEYLASAGAKVFAEFARNPQAGVTRAHELSGRFAGRDTAGDFQVFGELLIDWLAAAAASDCARPRGARLAEAHDAIVYSFRRTDALNLDRRQAAFDALLAIDRAMTA
ncbi:MAG: DNA polymerase III subunit delta' [Alphaproteobacteria bacterium]|nr:DNA polymerase III subunit delta' [Alphaproteobacteria bacterium]